MKKCFRKKERSNNKPLLDRVDKKIGRNLPEDDERGLYIYMMTKPNLKLFYFFKMCINNFLFQKNKKLYKYY